MADFDDPVRHTLRVTSERRSGEDRRKVNVGPPPPGIERRQASRRSGGERRKNQ